MDVHLYGGMCTRLGVKVERKGRLDLEIKRIKPAI
jgi:hypothetical protein